MFHVYYRMIIHYHDLTVLQCFHSIIIQHFFEVIFLFIYSYIASLLPLFLSSKLKISTSSSESPNSWPNQNDISPCEKASDKGKKVMTSHMDIGMNTTEVQVITWLTSTANYQVVSLFFFLIIFYFVFDCFCFLFCRINFISNSFVSYLLEHYI
jgi:hypothetical protein